MTDQERKDAAKSLALNLVTGKKKSKEEYGKAVALAIKCMSGYSKIMGILDINIASAESQGRSEYASGLKEAKIIISEEMRSL